MNSYTIVTLNKSTGLWGWLGTQHNVNPEEDFEGTETFHYRDEIITLPKHFLHGARVHVKRLVGTSEPTLYWIENSIACRADLGEV